MRYCVFILAGLVSVGSVLGLPKMPEKELLDRAMALEQARTVTREVAPDAQSLTLAQAQYTEYAADGTEMLWFDFWAKALTEMGTKDLRDIPIPFQKGFSEAEFHVAEIVRADGSIETLDLAANVHEATSNRDTDANIYDDSARQIVLTVPELHVGDTLHVVTAYHTKRTRIPDTWTGFSQMEAVDEPILYSSVSVLAPKELPLKHFEVLGEIPGTITKSQEILSSGDTLYRWVARDVPPTFKEQGMPKLSTQLQRVVLSTWDRWEDISKWYWGLCEPHMLTTPAIDAKVAELTKGKSREEQITALFGFVAQEVRYMGIIAEDDAPGYEPHDVSLTFDNRYGVCRDKGALLVAMLRKAGFDAFPVLINAGSKLDLEVPIPYFNHAVIAIDEGTDQGGDKIYRLMDPTDDTARAELPAYLSDCTYVVCRPEGDSLRTTPVPPATDNLLDVTSEGLLDASGTLTYKTRLVCAGLNDNVYRPLLIKYSPEDVRDRFDGLLKRTLPGAEIVSYSYTPKDPTDISQPLTIELEARVEGYAITDTHGQTLVTLPFMSRTAGFVNYLFQGLDQPTRKYDWEIAAPCAVREVLTLRGFESLGTPTLLPEDPIFKSNGASYDVRVKRDKDGTLTLTREVELLHKSYTPEDYLALRRFKERIARAESVRPLFTKTVGHENDAHILSLHQSTTLDAEGRATRRTQRDTKILTFQGKRLQGEVKLYHNPAWQTLTLHAAEVTTPKGDRVSVTEKEINDLDDDQAAFAPRYTFAKEKVISLPGIDVGSVAHLDWQIEDKDIRPFAETITFTSTYPTDEWSYTLTTPIAMESQLRIAERNFETAKVKRTMQTKDDCVIRTWTLSQLPALRRERSMPSAAFFCPTLHISLRDAAAHRVFPRVIRAAEGVVERDSERLEDFVEDLMKEVDEEAIDQRIQLIQTTLAQRIRPLGPSWNALPFMTFTPPEQTFTEGYANRLDRLLLQKKLLALAEIETELVFASQFSMQEAYTYANALALREVPNWGRWLTPYLRLADGRLIGDEGEFSEIGSTARGNCSLMTAHGRILYEQPDALRNQVRTTRRIILETNGDARITLDQFSYGLAAGAVRRAKRDETPETRRRTVASLTEAIAPGAKPFSEYIVQSTAYPVRTRLGVKARHYAQRQKQVLSMPLPEIVSSLYNLRGTQRTAPIAQSETAPTVNVTDIWLPKSIEILSKPEPFTILLPGGGAYTLTCEQQTIPATGMQRLTYTATYSAAPAVLQNWQYPALLELDRRLLAPTMHTLLLRLPE